MRYLDWIQYKRDHLEETALWDSHQLHVLEGSKNNIQATLSLDSFTNKTLCLLYKTDLNRFLILCLQQPVAVRSKDRQPCRIRLRAAGSSQTSTVNAICWTGKPCLLITGEHTSDNYSDRYKKSFLLLPSFPQKCKSWEGLVLQVTMRPATNPLGQLVQGRVREERSSVFSLACRDGTQLNKSRSTRNTMSAAITTATAPDNPSWKHPHPVPNRNAIHKKYKNWNIACIISLHFWLAAQYGWNSPKSNPLPTLMNKQ